MLQKLQEAKVANGYNRPLVGIQRSQYVNSKNEYLCITLARPLNRWPQLNHSVTIGLLINNELKKRLAFLSDPKIILRLVNESCERCPLTDCKERAAAPVIYDKAEKTKQLEDELNQFISAMKNMQTA